MRGTTRVNFHCHSDISDGTYTSEALAELLVRDRVQYASLTDHDSLAGLQRFRSVLEHHGVGFIPGVEITAQLGANELHLLAYGFDISSPELNAAINAIRRQRQIGLQTVIDSLKTTLNANPEAPQMHAERPSSPYDCAAIIQLVHKAGGRVFLAHPMAVSPDWGEVVRVVRALKQSGLDGLEAYYPDYAADLRETLVALARDEGLLVIGGTDLHGPNGAGQVQAGLDVPTRVWKDFRDALAHQHLSRPRERTLKSSSDSGLRWRRLLLHIALPALLAIGLFLFANFAVLLPAFHKQLLERKRETVRELTLTATSLLEQYARDEQAGRLTQDEAQRLAMEAVRGLRYGPEGKDYFWITDARPYMVMHPYLPQLDGTDLSDFKDEHGKRLFVEFVKATANDGEGFVDYMWQWKDDATRVVPKLSYVRRFEPWDWIVGTGIYIEDVRAQIGRIEQHLVHVALLIACLIVALLLYVAHQSLTLERQRSRAEQALRESHERYRLLVETANEGTLLFLEGKCAYANRAILDLLGYRTEEAAMLDLDDLLPGYPEAHLTGRHLTDMMEGKPGPLQHEGQLRCKDGSIVNVKLTCQNIALGGQHGLILSARDMGGGESAVRDGGEASDALLAELQSSLLFLNEPVGHFQRETIVCSLNTDIASAARLMTQHDFSAALVVSESGTPLGIITDADLRRRVLGDGGDVRRPVHEVMTSPLVTIDEHALVHEALLRMQDASVDHVAVKSSEGQIKSVVRGSDLLQFHRYASAVVVGKIQQAQSVADVVAARERLPLAIRSLLDVGARPQTVTRLLSSVHDAATERLLRLAMDELGPPPSRFAFICMGSEGREEETLVTDQDNGIIYQDVEPERAAQAQAYFLRLGDKVCQWLDTAGYRYCNGGVMAREAAWCGSSSVWQDRFARWIAATEPDNIRRFDMCFDFRCVYGAEELTHGLRRFVFEQVAAHPDALAHFALNAMQYKPPLGFFGKIVTRSAGEHEKAFDVKEAMMPIVMFARIYALREKLPQINTLERLERMAHLGVLSGTGYNEIRVAYEFLTSLRLKHQSTSVTPNNLINPKALTHIEEATLRESFAQIAIIQKRISYEFLGGTEG